MYWRSKFAWYADLLYRTAILEKSSTCMVFVITSAFILTQCGVKKPPRLLINSRLLFYPSPGANLPNILRGFFENHFTMLICTMIVSTSMLTISLSLLYNLLIFEKPACQSRERRVSAQSKKSPSRYPHSRQYLQRLYLLQILLEGL